ncbi:MAG: hypothetical protein QXV69_08225 [Sulfolobaceae archaeon]
MLGAFDFNTIETTYLREEFDTIQNRANKELLFLINKEFIQKFSKSLLIILSEKLDTEVYNLKLKNIGSLIFLVNDKKEVSLAEYSKYATTAEYIANSYPHVFSLAVDYQFINKWEKYYKKVLKNNYFKSILDYIEGKKISRIRYTDAVYLFIFLKLTEN